MEDLRICELKKFDVDHTILSSGDPSSLYENLIEIGHGNFGAVFSGIEKGTNTLVAIKQISFDGKHSKEKFHDIKKEIQVIRKIIHENCVGFKDVYLVRSSVWLVMEHCVGSIYDIMENQNSGLSEDNISFIIYYVLLGLAYIHELKYIHRDIKAANILITESAVIKIADFGSASIKSPANTFVGSPYWMAPEVILAMEDGLYDTQSDMWSLGITAYELGEFKPPHYHLNTMSAIYHIAQSDPPQLHGDKWSEDYKTLTNSMLKREPSERPTARRLLDFEFLKHRSDSEKMKCLLYKCAEKTKKDNKFLASLHQATADTNSPTLTSDSISTDNESHIGEIRLKTYSPPYIGNTKNLEIVKEEFRTPPIDKKIETIRTTATVCREQQDHQDENYSQLKEYQRLRKLNMKQIKALELKLSSEISDYKKMQQKCLDSFKSTNEKVLRLQRDRQKAELEKLAKQESIDEHRLKKLYYSSPEDRNRLNVIKEISEKSRNSKSRSGIFNMFEFRSKVDLTVTPSSDSLLLSHYAEFPEILSLKKEYIRKKEEARLKFIKEDFQHLITSRELFGKMELETLKKIGKMEISRMEQIYALKKQHLEKLHSSENQSQYDYMKKNELDLSKKHVLELKLQPKELKNMEAQIKKVYQESIRTQDSQYRFLVTQSLESTPKDQKTAVKGKLKMEKLQKIANLQSTMETHIANLNASEKTRLADQQKLEKEELATKLQHEMISLKNFQSSQLEQLLKARNKDMEKLESKMSETINQTSINIENEIKKLQEDSIQSIGSPTQIEDVKDENFQQITKLSNSVDALSISDSSSAVLSSISNEQNNPDSLPTTTNQSSII